MGRMPAAPDRLDGTSLDSRERLVAERLVASLASEFGEDLRSVWLFGSRARGEPAAREDSDVDILVIVRGGRRAHETRVQDLLIEAAEGEEVSWTRFSVLVQDPGWVEDRRRVRAFFIQGVDRDKVVLAGEP